jgi:hypothetical protein
MSASRELETGRKRKHKHTSDKQLSQYLQALQEHADDEMLPVSGLEGLLPGASSHS